MFRFSQRSRGGKVYPMVLGILGFELNKHDDIGDTPSAKKFEAQMRLQAPPNGWEGLKLMFSKQEPNGISVELLSCVQLGLCSFVTGFVIGGIDNTKFTVQEYKEKNQATMYRNTFEAQRSVQDAVSKDFFKGGYKMGLKCSSFLFCYSILTTSLSVYRGKTSISDFALSGAVTGAIFTLNRGLPGAITGGTVGLVLGTFTGTIVVGALYITGIDMNKVRLWQYNQYQKRIVQENKAHMKLAQKSSEPVDQISQLTIKPGEMEHGRTVDTLDEMIKMPPAEADVVIPLLPPESMFRK